MLFPIPLLPLPSPNLPTIVFLMPYIQIPEHLYPNEKRTNYYKKTCNTFKNEPVIKMEGVLETGENY